MSTINASAGSSLSGLLAQLQQQVKDLNGLIEAKPMPTTPGTAPNPDYEFVMPAPGPILPSYEGSKPTTMWNLEGQSVRDIARGIIAMYDQDGDGRVNAQEAVRVQRQYEQYGGWYGYGGGMRPLDHAAVPDGAPPQGGVGPAGASAPVHDLAFRHPFSPFGNTRVDVYSMTKLLFAADANHNGKVGVSELARHLRTFDTGDSWYGDVGKPGMKGGTSSGDRRLSGSEFWKFMSSTGEQHVASWTERRYPDYYYRPPVDRPMYEPPLMGGGKLPTQPVEPPVAQAATHSAEAVPAAADDSGD